MTMNDNLAVVRAMNNRESSQIFVDKCQFNHRFGEYLEENSWICGNVPMKSLNSF